MKVIEVFEDKRKEHWIKQIGFCDWRNVMNRKQMTIVRLLAMTIIPSAIATALYIVVGIYMQNIPSLDLFFIITTFTLFPYEMWVVLSANKQEFGKYGLQIVVSKCEKVKWWKVFLYGSVLFGFAGIMSATVAQLESKLTAELSDHLYSLLPVYFDWTNLEMMKQYSKGMLIFTSIFYLVMNVLICPVMEEIYFRGYLTNKMQRYGMIAPIIVTVVFSLYHWWLPFNNIFRICIFAVAAVIAYQKKNIYISMVFHCLCNLFSSISFIVSLLSLYD